MNTDLCADGARFGSRLDRDVVRFHSPTLQLLPHRHVRGGGGGTGGVVATSSRVRSIRSLWGSVWVAFVYFLSFMTTILFYLRFLHVS